MITAHNSPGQSVAVVARCGKNIVYDIGPVSPPDVEIKTDKAGWLAD